jgi:hypothetical protein
MLILGHPLLIVQRLSWISKQITCKEYTQKVKINIYKYVCFQHVPIRINIKYRRNVRQFVGSCTSLVRIWILKLSKKDRQIRIRIADSSFSSYFTSSFYFLQLFLFVKVYILSPFLLLIAYLFSTYNPEKLLIIKHLALCSSFKMSHKFCFELEWRHGSHSLSL